MSAKQCVDLGIRLESVLLGIQGMLSQTYGMSSRSLALLLLQGDQELQAEVKAREPEAWEKIQHLLQACETCQGQEAYPYAYTISQQRQTAANRIAGRAIRYSHAVAWDWRERLNRIIMHPLTGLPILLLVLYFGLYKFVGEFGAGTLVGFLEGVVFEKHINPWLTHWVLAWLPWTWGQDLLVGEYGVLTLGLRYAVALILPVVTTFFIAFAIIEDSGYLPRLAMLIDRLFKTIGLTGRAVIPMVLGLGCDTMATMVTRTLPSRRERLIATILLAVAVPCSAQLGVILALLANNPAALWIWVGVMTGVFVLIGYLSSQLLPGEAPVFYMEIPPLRLPSFSNVLIKTYSRVKWYFQEIFPIFILASVLIWLGKLTGLFVILVQGLEHVVRWLGLPKETAVAFLFGFFRRDYGAGGLYDIKKAGLMDGNQLVVACITLTLFLPCIAQFLMTVKERGWRTGLAISGFVLLFSFAVGYAVNAALVGLGVQL